MLLFYNVIILGGMHNPLDLHNVIANTRRQTLRARQEKRANKRLSENNFSLPYPNNISNNISNNNNNNTLPTQDQSYPNMNQYQPTVTNTYNIPGATVGKLL